MLFLYLTQSKTITFYDDNNKLSSPLLLNNRERRTQIPHGWRRSRKFKKYRQKSV